MKDDNFWPHLLGTIALGLAIGSMIAGVIINSDQNRRIREAEREISLLWTQVAELKGGTK